MNTAELYQLSDTFLKESLKQPVLFFVENIGYPYLNNPFIPANICDFLINLNDRIHHYERMHKRAAPPLVFLYIRQTHSWWVAFNPYHPLYLKFFPDIKGGAISRWFYIPEFLSPTYIQQQIKYEFNSYGTRKVIRCPKYVDYVLLGCTVCFGLSGYALRQEDKYSYLWTLLHKLKYNYYNPGKLPDEKQIQYDLVKPPEDIKVNKKRSITYFNILLWAFVSIGILLIL